MPNAPSVAVTIVYVFATLQFITCIFLLIGVKQVRLIIIIYIAIENI